eukprot:741054-Pleurochrysis_carterae.AAC.1
MSRTATLRCARLGWTTKWRTYSQSRNWRMRITSMSRLLAAFDRGHCSILQCAGPALITSPLHSRLHSIILALGIS